METARSKSDGKQMGWSGNNQKQAENMQKIFLDLFGSVRPGVESPPSENQESLEASGFTAFSPSPVTGQKTALTTCLTTIGKLHNRV